MGVALANRDLRLGRLWMVSLEDEVAEAVGDALNADESGVAVARRRPRQFTFTFPIRGANADPNPYLAGARMRRQIRAMMENTTLRLQGLYLNFTQDTEIDGWMIAGSGLLKYDQYGLTFNSFMIELDSSYRVGGLRTHMPARRVELYDRRLKETPRDFKGTIFGTDFSAVTPLALTSLPVGANNPIGYLQQPVIAQARAGFDGTGYVLQGLQHGNVIGFEQEATNQNLGDVVIYDRRGVSAATVPEEGVGTNLILDPGFEYDTVGSAPPLWGENSGGNYTVEAFAVSEGWAATGKKSQHVKVKHTSGSLNTFGVKATQPATCPVKVGKQYTVQAALNILSAAAFGFQVTFSWYKADNATQISSEASSASFAAGTGLQTLTKTSAAAPAEAAFLRVEIRAGSEVNGATIEFYLDNVACVEGTVAPTTWFNGDTNGYFWTGTPGASVSTIDPQNFGWEEVYGPDQKLTSGDVVVLTNQLCRIRYVATTGALAIDTAPQAGVWTEQGRVTLWDSAAADTYTQHTYPIPRSGGALSTVMEWTPERAVIRLSTNRSSSESTARLDTYITLQRGWTGPRIESYCNIIGTTTPGCQVKWTPATEGNMIEANLVGSHPIYASDDALFPWASSPGPTYQEVGEPWVELIPTAGGQLVTLTSIQQGARGPNTSDNAAYGGSNRQSAAIAARYAENQNNTATQPTYGYVSAHIGFCQQQQELGVFEAETWRLVRAGCTEVADAAASGGHAINDTQANPLQSPVQANLTSVGSGGGLAAGTYFYKVTAKNGAGETLPSNEKSITVSGGSSKVTISWAEVPGATAYVVYRGTVTNTENVKHEVSGGSTLTLEDTGASVPTFPEALSVSDTFLRTESPLSNGAKWTLITGDANTGTTNATNGWEASAFGTLSGARWNVAEQTNPATTMTLHTGTPAAERWFAVWACLKAAEKSGYSVRMTETSANVYTCTIERWAAGVATTIKTITGVSFTTGNTIGIGVRSGKVSAWKLVSGTWSQIGEEADATYTKGYSGIEGSGSNPFYTNFSFGEMTAATAGTPFSAGSPPVSNTATVTTAASLLISSANLNAKGVPVGRYGIWARVRVTTSGDTLSITGGFGVNQTAIKTSTSLTYVWLYLGESLRETTSQEYSMTLYQSGGTGITGTRLDRVVLLPTEYRTTGHLTYDGGRDLAVIHLYDSQWTPDLVER